jgi:molecular chaperone GrpE
MVEADMSGDGSETPAPDATSSDGAPDAQGDSGSKAARPDAPDDIPVEVEAPAAPAAPDWEAKIATLEKEKKDNWDRYLRAAADLENLRKRTKRELEDAKYEAKVKTLKEMLPVVDNLERAIEHAGGAGAPNPIVEGVQLVLRQFQTAFERLEVVPVEAQDKPFDPNLHEAISQQESDAAPGTIVQVLQRGYKIGDRLLRPSLVVVAKPPAPKPAE